MGEINCPAPIIGSITLTLHQPGHELIDEQTPVTRKGTVIEATRSVCGDPILELFRKLAGITGQMKCLGGQFADSYMIRVAIGPIRAKGDYNIGAESTDDFGKLFCDW